MILLGIDPGNKGAMCIMPSSLEWVRFINYDLDNYAEYLRTVTGNSIAIVERVHAMPGQGVKSMFSFGQRLGEIEGLLRAFKIPYQLVPPKEWQKECGIAPKSDKKAIAGVLKKLYPQVDLYGARGGLQDGKSDALGLAHYARLKYGKDN